MLFFFDQAQADEIISPLQNSNKKNVTIRIAQIPHYSLAEQLQLPQVFNSEPLDLLHVPHFNVPIAYRSKFVVTIHDLLWHQTKGRGVTTLPSWQYWLKYGAYRFVTSQAVNRSARILVPSQTVAKTISKHYPSAHAKLVITPEGIDPVFRQQKPSKRHQNQLLYVGSLYPHKNVELVLKALVQLPEHELVLVGTRDVFAERTKQLAESYEVSDRVIWRGRLSNAELAQQYAEATTLVQPSLSEGFGLTGVEAMACSTPVLASDIPVFREVYQDAAVYFDPHSVESFIAALKTLPKNTQKLLDAGRKVQQEYQWQHTAKQTWNVYHEALR